MGEYAIVGQRRDGTEQNLINHGLPMTWYMCHSTDVSSNVCQHMYFSDDGKFPWRSTRAYILNDIRSLHTTELSRVAMFRACEPLSIYCAILLLGSLFVTSANGRVTDDYGE